MDALFDSEDNETNSTQKNKKPASRRKKGVADLSSLMQDEPDDKLTV